VHKREKKVLADLHDISETSAQNSINESEHEKSPEQLKIVEDLQQQLADQETLRVSLEEKIKQLTKLILVSTSVPQESSSRNRSITGSTKSLFQKLRSKTHSMTEYPNKDKYNSISLPLGSPPPPEPETPTAATTDSISYKRVSFSEPSRAESDSDLPEITKDSIINALKLKLEAVEEQSEWRNKQLEKLKKELKDRNEKIEALLAIKIAELKKDDMEALKVLAIQNDQQVKKMDELKDTLQEKEFEIEIQKADNQFLREKITGLEVQV